MIAPYFIGVSTKGFSSFPIASHPLVWNVENRLESVSNESYLYDENGVRIKKTVGSTTTFYPFAHYEVTGATATKYYSFNGMLVAERQGSTLYYLHTDHLSSVALTTTSTGTVHSSEQYYAYGKRDRLGAGAALPTTIDYTGQRRDGSGLLYYQARYYDPAVGVFVSPDSIIPDPDTLIDYNRYAYARANPLKYNDPSGHCSADGSVEDGYQDECWKYVDDIINAWDDTDYWNKRWVSKENFLTYVAPTAHNDAEYMMGELNQYWGSDAFKSWKAAQPVAALTSYQLASQADPVCAGEKICQNMVQGAEKVDIYCSQNDCLTQSLDIIATSTAAGAAGCAAGIITAPCSLPLAAISVAASGSGAVWTAYQVYQGHGDEFDLATAGTTLIIGINSTPGVGVAASAYQTYWDFFRPH